MIEKAKTLWWFLKQPKLYPQLLYLIMSRLLENDPEKERLLAKEWCKSRAVPVEDAYHRITGKKMMRLREEYGSIIDKAESIANRCPVVMGGPGDIDLLYNLVEHVQADKIIETGVAYGWSSLAILLSLRKRKGARLISSDMPYAKIGNEDYVGCVVADELRGHWRLIRLPDRQSLPKAIAELGEIDMCHYDSDKSYRGKKWAYPILWSVLRTGGMFVSDDISDDFAFKDFCVDTERTPLVIRSYADTNVEKYVGILIK